MNRTFEQDTDLDIMATARKLRQGSQPSTWDGNYIALMSPETRQLITSSVHRGKIRADRKRLAKKRRSRQ